MATKKVAVHENKLRADILTTTEKLASLAAAFEEYTQYVQATYVTKAYVHTYIEQILGDIMPIHDPYTENTPIYGYTPLDITIVLKHFRNIKSTYTLNDYRTILMNYDIAANAGNINPYIAVAQMVKETDWCRSWWSQRPRRNSAGIGVTGETSKEEKPKDTWAFDNRENIWKKGYSFTSWEVSAQAHIGHLLAYANKDTALDESQHYLVAVDPRARFIPAATRGTVKLLKDLDGKWASPGIGYGKSISVVANALRT